jgi:hypothetical protein
MALNFRQGYKQSKLEIWINNEFYQSFIFPRTNYPGMIENHNPNMVMKKNIGRNYIAPKLFGFESSYTLHFDKYAAPLVLDYLKIIVDKWQEKDLHDSLELRFIPRLDTLDRIENVFPSPETITIAIMRGGPNAPGNKGVIIKFICLNEKSKLPIYDPNNRVFGFFAY